MLREPENGMPQCRLGGNVDDVRPKRINRPMDRTKRRPRQMKLLVERQNERRDWVNILSMAPRFVVGMNQLDAVARLGEDANQLSESSRDAVDLGKIGFGDQCDAHGLAWGDLETNLTTA